MALRLYWERSSSSQSPLKFCCFIYCIAGLRHKTAIASLSPALHESTPRKFYGRHQLWGDRHRNYIFANASPIYACKAGRAIGSALHTAPQIVPRTANRGTTGAERPGPQVERQREIPYHQYTRGTNYGSPHLIIPVFRQIRLAGRDLQRPGPARGIQLLRYSTWAPPRDLAAEDWIISSYFSSP